MNHLFMLKKFQNNDISRVNLICKNVEATLHNEFVKVEIAG